MQNIHKIIHSSLALLILFGAADATKAEKTTSWRQCQQANHNCLHSINRPWWKIFAFNLRDEIYSLQEQNFNYRQAKKYSQAIAVAQQALAIAQQIKDLDAEWWARNGLAETYKDAGNLSQALQLHQQNLQFVRQNSSYFGTRSESQETQSLLYLSKVYTIQKNYPQAIQLLKQALAIENQLASPNNSAIRATVLEELGINFFLAGNIPEAESNLLNADRTYQNAYRDATLSTSIGREYEGEIELKRWLQQIRVAQNRTNEALELAEQNRAREFAALVSTRLNSNNSGTQVSVAAPNIEQIKQIAKAENATLVEYTVTYDYNSNWQLSYRNDTEFTATNLYIWVIKPTGEITFRRQSFSGQRIALPELVRQARESIGVRGLFVTPREESATTPKLQPSGNYLRQLHQLLIQPIADLLPKDPNAKVVFIPQDFLFLVPFPALKDAPGSYLIDRHTIVISPSIQVLALSRQQQQQIPNTSTGVLVVGNPTMPTNLPSLPGSEREARTIAQIFNTQPLTGNQATKAAVLQRLPGARIVHLATHGLLDDAFGAFSSIALAPNNGDDGFLKARDIISLKLNTELVVLSACNTGRGKINGDGILGLSRSFLASGVPSIIVSIWSVPDAPTASLMTNFYQEIKQRSDKAQALRKAMLATKKSFPNPINWAAFNLIGQSTSSPQLLAATGEATVATQPTVRSYYTVLPVPDNVTSYFESRSLMIQGEVDISYKSNLSAEELMNFYRQEFRTRGLPEDRRYNTISAERFQMIFIDAANRREVVIQASAAEQNNWGVSIRFEPMRSAL